MGRWMRIGFRSSVRQSERSTRPYLVSHGFRDSLYQFFHGFRGGQGVLAYLPRGNFPVSMGATKTDEDHMREIYEFTARTLKTRKPVPFGALIVHTKTGVRLMRAVNAVQTESDPSSHGETRTVRLACKKLKSPILAGYTMYSTCEPCPMCMANALWARLDRVVYGATIADANRHVPQIHIGAKELARRSDMHCVVDGPVLRGLCVTLFTHPNMRKAFRSWTTRKTKSS
jgi:tRNA(adenine34) deaminase